MAGGSGDEAALGVAHLDDRRAVLDAVVTQTGRPPFNPRDAVKKFCGVLREYRLTEVTGDAYAGETFRQDFAEGGVTYRVSPLTKSELYEQLEPKVNAAEVELLDEPTLLDQLLGLTMRGKKIDHVPGEHDDRINAAAGALWLVQGRATADFRDALVVAGTTQFSSMNLSGSSIADAEVDWGGDANAGAFVIHTTMSWMNL
jgi:hypothetical protein